MAAKTPPPKAKKSAKDVVTLKQICTDLKINAVEARVKLRTAVADKKIKHEAKTAWEWTKGSPELKKVREILRD